MLLVASEMLFNEMCVYWVKKGIFSYTELVANLAIVFSFMSFLFLSFRSMRTNIIAYIYSTCAAIAVFAFAEQLLYNYQIISVRYTPVVMWYVFIASNMGMIAIVFWPFRTRKIVDDSNRRNSLRVVSSHDIGAHNSARNNENHKGIEKWPKSS